MSKRQEKQSKKRRLARAERRRIEGNRRRTGARTPAQSLSAPQSPPTGRMTVPPPPELLALRTAIEEFLAGGGDVGTVTHSWSPASSNGGHVEVVVDVRLFGLTATLHGRITPITAAEFFGDEYARLSPQEIEEDWDWSIAATARLALDKILGDEAMATSAIVNWGIGKLMDDASFSQDVTKKVLARLDLPEDFQDLLDPIAKQLPPDEKAFWYGVVSDGLWLENVGDFLFPALEVELRGPLVDLLSALDEEALARLPGRYDLHARL